MFSLAKVGIFFYLPNIFCTFFENIFFGVHSQDLTRARTHKYILQGYFSKPEKSTFYTFTLFKKLFFKFILSVGIKVLTLPPKAERNNGNESR